LFSNTLFDIQQKKGSVSSNSFSYQRNPHQNHCQTIDEEESDDQYSKPIRKEDFCSPVRSELTVNNSEDNNVVTLVHTVSFYRRQQNSQNNTPLRKVFREQKYNQESATEDSDDGSTTSNEESALVQDKVKKLLDEVCKQQAVISQTSQALNLCAATIEFSGSTESVEGERHLLVATHRRQALLDEVSRLRVEGCLRPAGAPTEKGRLVIKEITLPLKQDYQRKLAGEAISGHHLVCLLKYNENVLATRTVPTLPGLLSVKFPDVLQLNNVYADFKVRI
jgi:actin-binding protein anillin